MHAFITCSLCWLEILEIFSKVDETRFKSSREEADDIIRQRIRMVSFHHNITTAFLPREPMGCNELTAYGTDVSIYLSTYG